MLTAAFDSLDRWATTKLGPLFITTATLLFSIGTLSYFEVIYSIAFIQRNPSFKPIALIISIYLSISTTLHYYYSSTIPPGTTTTQQPNGINCHPQKLNYCLKCLKLGITGPTGKGPIKPERAHHCRFCKACQLKYDHHCPWINQCVGLNNERYFLLFLFYLSISAAWVVFWGWIPFNQSLDFSSNWPFWTPRICVVLTWVLALTIGVTIGIMFGWQFILVAKGETTVESSDNEYYRQLFSQRGQKFINPYDLGIRRNIEEFFNISLPFGTPPHHPNRRLSTTTTWRRRRSWYTIFLPIKVAPRSDGWRWPKRPASEFQGVSVDEELTDDDDDDDDYDVLRRN